MAEIRDRIQHSLGDAYRLERELGGGGMSRVFVAHDVALDREVVVKVISPELAATVSLERFRREIHLAAKLQHPHIVPVLSAGEADGLPYYTMPLIDGRSLRQRLEGGALPVGEATAILRDVARALAFAHEHGVVHRDIKPDNVLLAGGSATVTDFGIAKALSSARGDDGATLTLIGTSLGTPSYMAPEQVAADPTSDHRVDIYAFGAMAYEVLCGVPPFHGRSQQQILTAQLTEAPPPLAERAPEVPGALAALVMRCLAKTPGERPQSATEIVRELESLGATSGAQVAPPRRRARGLAIAAAAVAVVAAAVVGVRLLSVDTPQLDRGVMAVVPFRIASADPSLHYLREGMLDLLAAKLTGEGGLRATEPRTLLTAWRGAIGSPGGDLGQQEALRLARDLGAGSLLLGDVVGTPTQLVLNASLLGVPGGDSIARVSVQGAPDSLAWLVDRLAARLLTEVSGEGAQRATSLTSTPLEALRAYLDGQAKLRRGQTFAAREEFLRAVEIDSTFALAGIGLHQASVWGDEDGTGTQRGLQVAWGQRERLGPRDRALLRAIAGPDYPDRAASRDLLQAREQYTSIAPDRPDAWYLLGDHLFHFGHVHDVENPRERALATFKRAVELDSTYVVPMLHGLELAVLLDDTATVRRFERLRLRSDTATQWVPIYRWFAATQRGDSARARTILDSLEADDPRLALRIVQHAIHSGAGAGEVRRLSALVAEANTTLAANPFFARSVHEALMALGRPREARALMDTMFTSDIELNVLVTRVRNGLIGGADSADAADAVAALERMHRSPAATDSIRHRRTRAILRITEPWKLAHGDTSTIRRSLAELRAAIASERPSAWGGDMDVAVLAAMHADLANAPDARATVERLDSILRGLDYSINRVYRREMANLVAARLLEKSGDLERALAAARRRGDAWVPQHPYLGTFLREEGRLAALLGRREQAIAAYRQYLALRVDAEPQLQDEVEGVRKELARLEGASGGR
ncbi:MAG TPA: serine/threonine-protein kinase [Gemmatimonadaceae bacterium]|nr:serine/threonine-protein kinase [Gemmatimonadaceae bacterium]